MSPNTCAEAAGTLNPASDHAPVPYLRLLAPPQPGCAGPRLSEPQCVRSEQGVRLQRKPNSVPACCASESHHPPTFSIAPPLHEPQPDSESLSPAPSLLLHSSKEAWVARIKRLIDEGKNLKLALTVT